jgi:F-type H+-transporting ATPase subunit delta
MNVTITSAVALSKDQLDTLVKGLKKKFGSELSITVDVKPEVIGGLSVTVGSQHYDGTVRFKLASIKKSLQE